MTASYLHAQLHVTLPSVADTQRLATALARLCCAGDLIRLEGDLGAGKTTFAQAFLHGMGLHEVVPSPTYSLMQTYRTPRFMVAHLDCYRLASVAELVPLGLEDFRACGVVLAEWPDRGGALLAADQPDMMAYHINSIENPGVLTVQLAATPTGGRIATLRPSASWQRRCSLLPSLGVDLAECVTRPRNELARRAFLDRLGVQGYFLAGYGGDWSSRSYARVTLPDGSTRMLMDSPPPIETVAEYADVAAYYRSIGLRAAQVYGRDEGEGFLLTEDFGDISLWHAMQPGAPATDVAGWFGVAAEALAVQCRAAPPPWARRYTRRDWWVEGMRWCNWYQPFATGQATEPHVYARWQAALMPLYQMIDATPRGLMMWDCQSPNLMLLGPEPRLEALGLIDIQDARFAPVAQDVGLLVRNIRTGRCDAHEEVVVQTLVQRLGIDEKTLRRGLAAGALHHMVRILGGLTRLAVRDGRPGPAQAYLARTWEVVEQCLDDPLVRAEFAELAALMRPFKQAGLARLPELGA